ncbi:hypothetical protein [Enterococcus rivorum]|uniref:ABC transporter permease n=1 Tax=Enterococcus rivorum TaxID=762845 RepID=A0A1E5KXU7_9ENTE|nr:hypothetical protein [Enterococcus rivorum]MBP2099647.1 hypothetical protein [Enterococcus rivorum]OEH82675.1 hypothetical protein BCR26_12115 [Enterococcus rivorum]
MDKQLMTILKKRYGLFLVLAIVVILGTYTLSGINGASSWKATNESIYSPDQVNMLKKDQDNFFYEDKYQGLSFDEKLVLYQKESLDLFLYNNFSDGYTNKKLYNSFYYKEAFFPLLIFVSATSFLLFFADLKTSFNTFLFSLGTSKKKIYWYKHLLVSVPFLLSILVGKFILTGIILANIPERFINISSGELLSSIIGSWITLVFFYSAGSFIGLVTGNLVLAPLTVLGFTVTMNWFIAGFVNGWNYFIGNHSDAALFYQSDFFYELGQNKVNWSNVAMTSGVTLLLIFVSAFLYPKLSLEKNGNYLLFDALRIPVLLLFIFYTTVTFTFSGGLFSYVLESEKSVSAIPTLLIYGIISTCIGSYIIFRNQINSFLYKKFILKNKKLY